MNQFLNFDSVLMNLDGTMFLCWYNSRGRVIYYDAYYLFFFFVGSTEEAWSFVSQVGRGVKYVV